MSMPLKKLWLKGTVWLVAEILLSLIGLDHLADYSEFLFDRKVTFAKPPASMEVIILGQYR